MTTRASGERSKQKDRPNGTGLCISKIDQRRSKLLVRGGGRLVDGVLGGFLGVADGLLALAFDFLNHAFALQPVGTDGFADALLGLSDGFVGGAFNLVCRATHGTLRATVELHEDKPHMQRKFLDPSGLRSRFSVPSATRFCGKQSDGRLSRSYRSLTPSRRRAALEA